ncbi:hypothetical protein CHS0354_039587 [Potamilus streckersoni]|uniref:S-adenosylmethionine-dependent methyltransferase Rv2258c-like winged HTH domain-containing protein n=1 Tax=Potamilus streckersoni TaxID=2493646 RepID=A0AAE0VIK3_9BIVA|nr:hypothetical protein CHS0354_039587 [Potamilus streckersoni]
MEESKYNKYLTNMFTSGYITIGIAIGWETGVLEFLCKTDQPLTTMEIADGTKLKERYREQEGLILSLGLSHTSALELSIQKLNITHVSFRIIDSEIEIRFQKTVLRYVREWLGCMVAANVVILDAQSDRYHVPANHKKVLLNQAVFSSGLIHYARRFDMTKEVFAAGGPKDSYALRNTMNKISLLWTDSMPVRYQSFSSIVH